MSRRIALVIVGLAVILLVAAVVPLGLSLTANEQNSFRFDAQSAAHQIAAQSEEFLADHDPATAMNEGLAQAAAAGDCAAVFDRAGKVVASTPCPEASGPEGAALAAQVNASHPDVLAQEGDWLRVAVPIGDDQNLAGAAVLARSADPVNDRIALIWTWLGATGFGVLLLGILCALGLGRWVARPLTVLRTTAASFGDGELESRAPTESGPPEVRELSQVFNRMAERTQSLVGSHRDWVADVSHQLRTPLTALRLRVDVLADEAEHETATEMAGLQTEIARLASMVDGLLAVARAEGSVPHPEPVDADEVAADRVAAWEPVARERGVTLRVERSRGTLARLGPGDLEQMLDNLVANALDSVPEGGRIVISTVPMRGRVRVLVADDGPGMSRNARENAFRRFGRSGTGGAGLGLAIVHRLAAANGAEVALGETPGGGLTVTIDLPGAR